ncbi:hypothetical protein K438DRAFT_2169534 [Mycena galopus ATCC 62051]|nr:hypothetical protein K438DRAFT_2169534 [Mycena galopus ATCC 62051]
MGGPPVEVNERVKGEGGQPRLNAAYPKAPSERWSNRGRDGTRQRQNAGQKKRVRDGRTALRTLAAGSGRNRRAMAAAGEANVREAKEGGQGGERDGLIRNVTNATGKRTVTESKGGSWGASRGGKKNDDAQTRNGGTAEMRRNQNEMNKTRSSLNFTPGAVPPLAWALSATFSQCFSDMEGVRASVARSGTGASRAGQEHFGDREEGRNT